jgi:membrane protease YdiL (CAAX protease family)
MTERLPEPLGFWPTVRLLLGASRKRSKGRQKRQQELMRTRAGKSAIDWGGFAYFLAAIFALVLNGIAAVVVMDGVEAGERVDAERAGKIVVSHWYYRDVARFAGKKGEPFPDGEVEALSIAREYGGDANAIEKKLDNAASAHGTRDFATEPGSEEATRALPRAGGFTNMAGSLLLLWWVVMLVCQGEGLELDLQRRRHPMWEWLFSHPVRAGPVFLAEMFSPLAANPMYWGAPLMPGVLFGMVYGVDYGIIAAVLIGFPVMIAGACMGKALEIGIILRFAPRSRGAMIGLISWLGYASTILLFPLLISMSHLVETLSKVAGPLAALPWPWLRLFLGIRGDGTFSFVQAIAMWWLAVGIAIPAAVGFSVWGAQRGLSGNFASEDMGPRAAGGKVRFGKEPLYRKEMLWFIRDRSAIVQTILIPLTVASYQIFNLRGLLAMAQNGWNYLSGTAILFGTYFLWVLGPKSLSSEGSALWIALTWPRGLESLLKAKAWLWTLIATGIVALVMAYAALMYPASAWKVLLVGIGWFFFARSMAEKTVTLVTVTSESGEPGKIPLGRRMAASLGMLTFSIGVFTQQWHVAIMGIVYSYLTAAAMWENFRARLPYLYDVWSEKLPPAPTLMHAMIAISLLVEGGAVISGAFIAFVGPAEYAVVQALVYCVCAVAMCIGMVQFLAGRDVRLSEVLTWRGARETGQPIFMPLALGISLGAGLGVFARGYLWVMHHFAFAAQLIDKGQEQMAHPGLHLAYAIAAVGFAPFAEEFLFRGLLYRALDREWGGWEAVLGSAAFFAIYHQPLAWLPVGLLGTMNAKLFKKTGYLLPAVLAHMVYNAVVVI